MTSLLHQMAFQQFTDMSLRPRIRRKKICPMKQIPNCGDERTLSFCAFCGGETGTKDHCPSKVFLDEPYPENLPEVLACRKCNLSFSLHEEYVACLVSCAIAGSTDPELSPRPKTNRILRDKPKLRAMLEQARSQTDGKTSFIPDHGRVSSVFVKLAQGHALYELHELCARPPDELFFSPLELLSRRDASRFEASADAAVWPEAGSRALQRLVTTGSGAVHFNWISVQPGRYRYCASAGIGIEIRIVINEYLACFAMWK